MHLDGSWGAINRWNEMLKVIQVHVGTQAWWWVKKEGFSKMRYANLTTILPLQRGNAQVYAGFSKEIHTHANGGINHLLSTCRCVYNNFHLGWAFVGIHCYFLKSQSSETYLPSMTDHFLHLWLNYREVSYKIPTLTLNQHKPEFTMLWEQEMELGEGW